MAEYQDILKFLAENPPHLDPEKKFHASLLEMLAKRLRDETKDPKIEALKHVRSALTLRKKFH
jgi:hypothetical protein